MRDSFVRASLCDQRLAEGEMSPGKSAVDLQRSLEMLDLLGPLPERVVRTTEVVVGVDMARIRSQCLPKLADGPLCIDNDQDSA